MTPRASIRLPNKMRHLVYTRPRSLKEKHRLQVFSRFSRNLVVPAPRTWPRAASPGGALRWQRRTHERSGCASNKSCFTFIPGLKKDKGREENVAGIPLFFFCLARKLHDHGPETHFNNRPPPKAAIACVPDDTIIGCRHPARTVNFFIAELGENRRPASRGCGYRVRRRCSKLLREAKIDVLELNDARTRCRCMSIGAERNQRRRCT